MNVIFLDVDGVLNTIRTKVKFRGLNGVEPERIKLLKDLVNTTKSEIVLCSDWRCYPEFKSYLETELKKAGLEIYGETPEINQYKRETEIKEWLNSHEVNDYYILDDTPYYEELKDRWIDTSRGGLTLATVCDVMAKVAGRQKNI